jgi:hypothetical protein
MLVKYDIPEDNDMWKYYKVGHMAKITYQHKDGNNESFWLWIDKIEDEYVNGIISNNLVTFEKNNINLKIGDIVKFKKTCIKTLSERNYTKEQTLFSIENSKNNPITDYFQSLNIKFKKY